MNERFVITVPKCTVPTETSFSYEKRLSNLYIRKKLVSEDLFLAKDLSRRDSKSSRDCLNLSALSVSRFS